MYEVTNRKMLKGTRRVSDVERICQENHERRKLAEEYKEERIATASPKPRNDRSEYQKVLHTAFTACMMVTGGGATFIGIGIFMGNWQTVIVGTVITAMFLLTGCRLEDALEARQ